VIDAGPQSYVVHALMDSGTLSAIVVDALACHVSPAVLDPWVDLAQGFPLVEWSPQQLGNKGMRQTVLLIFRCSQSARLLLQI